MRRLFVCLSVVGLCVSTGLADGVKLQRVGLAGRLVPNKIGQLTADQTVWEWMEYHAGRRGCDPDLVFDCFEPDLGDQCPAPDGDGYDGEPIGGGTCGQGEPDDCDPSRHCPTYSNMYVANDMEFDPNYGGGYAERIEFAWCWYVNGPGTGENCAVMVETFEDFDDTCQTGDPNGPGDFLGGVVVLFGYYKSDPEGYYYADVDLCGLEWLQLPQDGAGSYKIWLLTYVGDDPDYPEDFSLATLGAPVLWGTGDGEQPIPDDRPGTQGPIQWNDVVCIDGFHEAPGECEEYSFGLCPDPVGAMFCIWAEEPDDCFPGDLDGDGDVDQADLGILLAAWCSHEGDPNWNERADIDDDGHVGHGDLGILLADWG